MNWRYVVIFAMVFVPFIMMGGKSFAPPEGYVPPDEFKDGIKARIEQPEGGFAGGGSPLMGGGNFTGFGLPAPEGFNSNISGVGQGGSSGSGNAAPVTSFNGAMPQPASSNQGNMGIITVPQGTQRNPQNTTNSVQPQVQPLPPALQQPYQQQPAPFQNLPVPGSRFDPPSGYPVFKDQRGKTVAFVGTEVYTVNAEGITIRMPDGTYKLNNGNQLVVRNGESWWPKNANKLN